MLTVPQSFLRQGKSGRVVLEYKQVQPPEGINTSKEHPLKEFASLVFTVLLIIAAAIAVLSFMAQTLASYIPFSAEKELAATFDEHVSSEEQTEDSARITEYLQSLADRLVVAQQLPEEMTISVHYIDDETVNAFATLGGHVFFFRGLLDDMPNENALAMVMAHEIAHIKHRHPIKSLGRAVVVGTAITVVSASMGNEMIAKVMGDTGLVTALKFSREQESLADESALSAVNALYGHVNGSTSLFTILDEAHKDTPQPPEFFSSHPHSNNRTDNLLVMAKENGWSVEGEFTALPQGFEQWIAVPESQQDSEDASTGAESVEN